MVRPKFRQGVEDGVNSEDRALFRQAMAGVEPLEPTPRVAVRRDGESPLATAARREAAVAEQGRSSPLGGGEVPLLDAHYPLEFRRVGVQHGRSEEHTSELQSRGHLVCRLLLEQKKEIT